MGSQMKGMNSGIEIVQEIAEGKYDEVTGKFSEQMKKAMDQEKLEKTFKSLEAQFGKIKNYECVEQTDLGDNGVQGVKASYIIKVIYEKIEMNMILSFDKEGKLCGLGVVPCAKDTEKPKDAVEKEMVVKTGKYELPATLTLPKKEGKFPVVVLVHGSGPLDRDENVYGTKVFKDIAYGLAEQGIATLRYDKRTYVYSEEVKKDPSLFDYNEEVIDDVLSAVQLVKSVPEINDKEIYVLGHSLGAMSVPMISSKTKDAAGYIIMSGPSRPLIDVVKEQLDYLYDVQGQPAKEKAAYMKQIEESVQEIKKLTRDSKEPALNFMGINDKVWADLNSYHQTEVAKQMKAPVFITQGGRDYQVSMEDFNGWKEALKGKDNVTFKDYPNMNHLYVEGEGKSTPNEYLRAGHVSQIFIHDLAKWILEKK